MNIETNTIYNEDCMQTLMRMEDESIDCIVTSPPYNKNAYASASGNKGTWNNMRGRQIPYDVYDDAMEPDDYAEWQKSIIRECMRVLKPTGSIFYNHKDVLSNGLIVSPSFIYEFPVHQQIIWNRGSTPALDTHYFLPITEYIYWIVKDTKKFYFDRSKSFMKKSIWDVGFDINSEHPAPFPTRLAKNCIICSTPPESIIYDPFMGSGTTAIATIQCGENREYIGSEISEKYIKIAEKRIAPERSQLSLF